MSDKTLWQLAKEIHGYGEHAIAAEVGQWAREKAKEWEKSREESINRIFVAIADLGVPEEP